MLAMVFEIVNVESVKIGQRSGLREGFLRCDLAKHYIKPAQQDLYR